MSVGNKEAWGRTTVPVDQHHGKRSLQKYQSKDLKKYCISDKMDGKRMWKKLRMQAVNM
jgi:hypothetical protein